MADEMIRHIDIDGKPRPLAASNLKKSGRIVIGIEGVHTSDDADVLLGATYDDAAANNALVQQALDDDGANEVVFLGGRYYCTYDYHNEGENICGTLYIRAGKRLIGCGSDTILYGQYEIEKNAMFELEAGAEISNFKIEYHGGTEGLIFASSGALGTKMTNIITAQIGGCVCSGVQFIIGCDIQTSSLSNIGIWCSKSNSIIRDNIFRYDGNFTPILIDEAKYNCIVENNHFDPIAEDASATIRNYGSQTKIINNTGEYDCSDNELSLTVGATTVPESKFKQLNEMGKKIEIPIYDQSDGFVWDGTPLLKSGEGIYVLQIIDVYGNFYSTVLVINTFTLGTFYSSSIAIDEENITTLAFDVDSCEVWFVGELAIVTELKNADIYAYKIYNLKGE